jgi:MoaA/NifB/PqqE/SkfB family radical SAM enzyme
MSEMFPANVFFTWDIHYSCNYNCTYCFLNFEPETKNIKAAYLSKDRWVKIWRDIYVRYGSCHIAITGGEPFIYPDFTDLIQELSEMHSFEFSTNLSWDVNNFMQKVSPDKAIINSSFHHEFVKIEDFLNKLALLKKNNYRVSITVVAYPPLLNEIADYKSKFEKEGFHLIVYPYRGPYLERKFPEGYTQAERNLLKELGSSEAAEVNKELFDTLVNKLKKNNPVKLCRMGQRYSKIVPSGEAYRCCPAVHKDWGKLGNIVTGTFNLSNGPTPCLNFKNCVCYRAMIVGEEDKWLGHWNA